MRTFYGPAAIGIGLVVAGGLIAASGKKKAAKSEAQALEDRAALEAATTLLEADALAVQVDLDALQLDRELRDLDVTRRKTTATIRAALASGTGEGLSSQLSRVVLGEGVGEFLTAEERLTQDTEIRRVLLLTRAENLRRIAEFTESSGATAAKGIRSAADTAFLGSLFSIGGNAALAAS